MKILSIETSCDETAISIIEAEGGLDAPTFRVLGNALYSQAKTHAEYGGVFPALAKREHARTMVPLIRIALDVAYKNGLGVNVEKSKVPVKLEVTMVAKIKEVLSREGTLGDEMVAFIEAGAAPDIDAIAVTHGPGLEPALWVGISVAKALHLAWNIPIVPVNHMEGHIISVLMQGNEDGGTSPSSVTFPALALLISGGHTELVSIEDWHRYSVIGSTRDDAVGEAFDKVARLLGLPYPGGPHISALAAEYRASTGARLFELPRPMITSPDFDFSFSGIKTSVLYTIKKVTHDNTLPLTDEQKSAMAAEFENAVTEVLISKVTKAIDHLAAQTLIIGGGVVANTYIRAQFEKLIAEKFPFVTLRVPSIDLSTDNSIMIGMAGYLTFISSPDKKFETPNLNTITAKGNLSLNSPDSQTIPSKTA